MFHQRKKPAKLMWTQSWRRLNKKGKEEGVAKKKARKAVRVVRAIVGASIDELAKKRLAPKPKLSAAEEAALKEVKERNRAAKKAANSGVRGPTGGAAVPKIQRSVQNARGGTTR